MDVHQPYCGNHFMIYVSQIIKLYTLNSYTAVCQLYLNKAGRKKKNCLREQEKKTVHTKTCTQMFIAELFIIAPRWKQPKCPSTDEWINKM